MKYINPCCTGATFIYGFAYNFTNKHYHLKNFHSITDEKEDFLWI